MTKFFYDDAQHHSIAAMAPDLLTVTFNGLSKPIVLQDSAKVGWYLMARKTSKKAILKA